MLSVHLSLAGVAVAALVLKPRNRISAAIVAAGGAVVLIVPLIIALHRAGRCRLLLSGAARVQTQTATLRSPALSSRVHRYLWMQSRRRVQIAAESYRRPRKTFDDRRGGTWSD